MRVLKASQFIKLNEQQVIQNITPITDEVEIKHILVHLANQTKDHPLNYEDDGINSVFDKTRSPECDKLTRQFASLDISYTLLQRKDISNLIAKIFYNSVMDFYEAELEDKLDVEEAYTAWCDDEPGDPGTYYTQYKMNYEFEDTVKFIIGECYALRTYNFQVLYDDEKDSICIYYDGYTPTDEYSAFADEYDKLPNDFIPIDNDLDLINDLSVTYDEYRDEAEKDYDPSDY